MGTAGGFLHFRKEITSGNPDFFFVLHCDIICTFPLIQILDFHKQHGKEVTIMGTKVK
jgi:mannose-1-phosphate guanylyltransferase